MTNMKRTNSLKARKRVNKNKPCTDPNKRRDPITGYCKKYTTSLRSSRRKSLSRSRKRSRSRTKSTKSRTRSHSRPKSVSRSRKRSRSRAKSRTRSHSRSRSTSIPKTSPKGRAVLRLVNRISKLYRDSAPRFVNAMKKTFRETNKLNVGTLMKHGLTMEEAKNMNNQYLTYLSKDKGPWP